MIAKHLIDTNNLEFLSKDDLLKIIKSMVNGGISINFYGKRIADEIYKKVRPRVTRVNRKLSVGTDAQQSKNLLIEGENLQAMVTLYKYQGQVDLILTDPPYNTGNYFRYNDKWDQDPNDPELGNLVASEDGSKHTKWMKAMLPRLHMMWKMLNPSGVLAICIDDNELFHLGMMLNEVFGEENRVGIINWQKTYSPKNDSTHLSSATEYVLVYAKDKSITRTGLLPRSKSADSRYSNPDDDPLGPWSSGDLQAKDFSNSTYFGIQSPFSGKMFYPSDNCHWRFKKKDIKKMLEEYGSKYSEVKDPENILSTSKSLVIKGTIVKNGSLYTPAEILEKCSELASDKVKNGPLPSIIFLKDGQGVPRIKRYLNNVKKGQVPLTFWADEEYDSVFEMGAQSWVYQESGHSQTGINELDSILGKGNNFETVKPLKLIKKIIQLWCPPKGLVLDPYAGSGTTGHAVVELNNETDSDRRFILIEQGNSVNGDKYARTLTQERLKRVIKGVRPDKNGNLIQKYPPLNAGFEFRKLTKTIDAKTVLSMKKDELVDLVITSHWESERRAAPNLIRIDNNKYSYLVGKNEDNEGYFIIWNGDKVGQLDIQTYKKIVEEASKEMLTTPYHVYARYEVFRTNSVKFYKVPDKILLHLGLNELNDSYNNDSEA
ncbi:site-specific DNA-methyltransferase [Sporolactobacillus putidus]|uniref:DNA methylase N-4/N-6 domain-containing protein n=1 Tax=Sporolactobacillus putidus TaxID=492735 RepID=A0A917S7G2_9BACL|nr:site-specific DNA-methyltransferase [Sporolactobacillus putidus]GGL63008.1 hypothetical protein GCM10007968_28660 [Sporolactobacillus putidus]